MGSCCDSISGDIWGRCWVFSSWIRRANDDRSILHIPPHPSDVFHEVLPRPFSGIASDRVECCSSDSIQTTDGIFAVGHFPAVVRAIVLFIQQTKSQTEIRCSTLRRVDATLCRRHHPRQSIREVIKKEDVFSLFRSSQVVEHGVATVQSLVR